jgi:hypothetical protein
MDMRRKPETLFDRIRLPARVIVNRFELSATDLSGIIDRGELSPRGGDVCELECGGQVLARGRIVRRRGRFIFKVLETAQEEGR